jgi:hypothetical protein
MVYATSPTSLPTSAILNWSKLRSTPSNKMVPSGGYLQFNLDSELWWDLELVKLLPDVIERHEKKHNISSRSET